MTLGNILLHVLIVEVLLGLCSFIELSLGGSMFVLAEDDSSKEGHKTMLAQVSTETTTRGKVR